MSDELNKLRELVSHISHKATREDFEAILPALEQLQGERDSLKIQWDGLQDRCHADFLKIRELELRERERNLVGNPSVEEWADWIVSRHNFCEREAGESLREIALVALRNVVRAALNPTPGGTVDNQSSK